MQTGSTWKWILSIFLLLSILVAAILFLPPYLEAKNAMPADTVLRLEEQQDRNFLLSWPAAEKADCYKVEIVLPKTEQRRQAEILFSEFISDGTQCILPGLPVGQQVLLSVNSAVFYGNDQLRLGDAPVERSVILDIPRIESLEWTADEEQDTVTVSCTMSHGKLLRIYTKSSEEGYSLLKTVEDNQATITFGEKADLPFPGYREHVELAFAAGAVQEGMEFFAFPLQTVTIVRDDLLSRDMDVQLQDEGKNVVTLSWSETKGESYRVEMKKVTDDSWTILGEIPMDGQRSFTTHHLSVTSDLLFRVTAVGGQTMPDSEFAAISEEIAFTTGASPIYATIWPTSDLAVYKDPEMTEEIGKVTVATAYCVLDEVGNAFAISLNGETVYIDSCYCLINLPDYLGDLCSYHITNSYYSIYAVHEYGIPSVTGAVTAGYERIRMADGTYLVPLLYPAAKRLLVAAEAAIEQGYRLKIYDAFRPNVATYQIYNLTEAVLDKEIPARTYKGGVMYNLPPIPEKENPEDPDPVRTYRLVMTNGTWDLSSFLAKGASMHNLGIALDLTLETLDGTELKMQTSMHDLSFYSTLYQNNANAKILAEIMKGAGWADLISEWWHFQDNEIHKELKPPAVWPGVTPECWMKDDFGWKYRDKYGVYLASGEFDIGSTLYSFDDAGYIITR